MPREGGPDSDHAPDHGSGRVLDPVADQAADRASTEATAQGSGPGPAHASARSAGGGLPDAVLFVCSMNAVRSPMAAAILRHLAGRRCYVVSAGVRAGGTDPFATAVMDEIGIDIAGHQPHTLQDLNDTSFDLIITLSPEAHHQALELTRTMAVDVEFWPTYDATVMLGHGSREQILGMYRTVRDQLFQRIKDRFGFAGGPTV